VAGLLDGLAALADDAAHRGARSAVTVMADPDPVTAWRDRTVVADAVSAALAAGGGRHWGEDRVNEAASAVVAQAASACSAARCASASAGAAAARRSSATTTPSRTPATSAGPCAPVAAHVAFNLGNLLAATAMA
jgi:hypothetical protein